MNWHNLQHLILPSSKQDVGFHHQHRGRREQAWRRRLKIVTPGVEMGTVQTLKNNSNTIIYSFLLV